MDNLMVKYTEFLQCLFTHKKEIWCKILNLQTTHPEKGKVYFRGFNKLEKQVTGEMEELYDTLIQISIIKKELENENIS